MKTLANVWLLPHSNQSTKLTMYIDGKGNHKSLSLDTNKLQYHTNQHLYITLPQSNLEISKLKEGDWCYHKGSKEVIIYPIGGFPKGCSEKIIATTDTSLMQTILVKDWGNTLEYQTDSNLPSIPQSFIEHFISEYNKRNIIKQVEIELVDKEIWESIWYELKRNQQNEVAIIIPELERGITIINVDEKMYSRKEVISLLNKLFFGQIYPDYTIRWEQEEMEKWIEENLK